MLGAAKLRALPMPAGDNKIVGVGETADQVKILTSCPSCLQGLSRYDDDADTSADYIVVEMAKAMLGPDWMANYVRAANAGGIERVLL